MWPHFVEPIKLKFKITVWKATLHIVPLADFPAWKDKFAKTANLWVKLHPHTANNETTGPE
jgi:hypothetical protein